MPTVLRFRRGDTTASNAFTGAEGELFIDTTKDTVVVHDGVTAGGKPLATETYVSTAISNLVNGAPGTLDTLKEIADQLASDESAVSALTTSVAGKVSLTGSYANPTWITSLAYNKLTGAPALATVATSGSYTDLINKPTLFSGSYTDLTNKPSIPSLTGYATESYVNSGLALKVNTSALATVATSGSYTDLTNKPSIPSITGLATEAYVNSATSSKQDTLVSGTNIKTINGTSLLGSGDITISGGGSANLTQVSSDITPMFDSVYDLGSTTNRFYDTYLSNKLNINDATLSGHATVVQAAVEASTNTTTTIHQFGEAVSGGQLNGGTITSYGNGTGAMSVSFDINSQQLLASFVASGGQTRVTSFTVIINGTTYAFTGLTPTGGAGGNNFGYNFTSVTPSLPASVCTFNYMDFMTYGYPYVVSIQLSEQTTVNIPASPAVYEYSLASNASLVAPEVIANTSLIGGVYTAGTTITPEHTLTTYTDAKGTLTVDGSLKVNDNLNVRNGIVLKQEIVPIGTVLSKSTTTSNETHACGWQDNWYNVIGANYIYFNDQNTIRMYSSNNMPWHQYFATIGSEISITFNNGLGTYIYTINSFSDDGMFVTIGVTPTNNAGVYNTIGSNTIGAVGYGSYNADISITSSVTLNSLVLDNASVAVQAGDKIAVNGLLKSAPVSSSVNITGTASSLGWQSGGNTGPNSYLFYVDSSVNLTTTTTQGLVDTMNVFTTGNNVTLNWNGNIGVVNVSNASIISANGYPNTGFSVSLTYVSGYDHISNGTFSYALGMMSQPINWTANIMSSVNYTTKYASQLIASTLTVNSYKSTSEWVGLQVGDTIGYIPNSTSIKFMKDDGTSIKAITYNNNTGAMTYDGIVIPPSAISIDNNYNIVSSDATPIQAGANSNVLLGKIAVALGARNVSIGYQSQTRASDQVTIGSNAFLGDYASYSVAIGNWAYNDFSSSSVAIGQNAQTSGWGNAAIAIGNGAQSNNASNSIAIGYGASATQTNNIALGKNTIASGSNTFFRMSTGDNSYANPTVELHRHAPSFSISNQSKYIGIGGAYDSTPHYNYLPAISGSSGWQRTTILGTAIVMIREATENTNRWKIIELKFHVRTTSSYVYSYTQISNTTLASGSDTTFNSAITTSGEILSNSYLEVKITNSTATSYNIGADIKMTFQVLTV